MHCAKMDEKGVPHEVQIPLTDQRDSHTLWLWVGEQEEYRLELTREDLMQLLKGMWYEDAYHETKEFADKMVADIKHAVWEAVYDVADEA